MRTELQTGIAAAIAAAALALLVPSAAAPTAVPGEYQSMYTSLRSELGAPFSVRPPARTPKPVWGAHLLVADSNRGPVLLSPGTLAGVDITLDRFQEMGIQGATVAIGYPLFTSSFNPDSSRYVDFYKAVAAKVRARGMKFTVEQIVLWPNGEFSPWTFDLSGLTMQQLITDGRQMAQTIIDQLHPDYLTILHEPDTYAVTTGLIQFFDPQTVTDYVSGVLQGLNRGDTKVGAGSGTWSGPWYMYGLLQTSIDYLDLHIYWVNPTSVAAGKEIAALVRAYGKPVVIDEAWLFKTVARGTEGLPGVEGNAAVFRRDVFSFFEPLDRKFLDQATRFAKSAGAEYFAPYWSNYFFAYLDYSPTTKDLPFSDLVNVLAPQAVAQALIADRFTKTGKQYARIIQRNG